MVAQTTRLSDLQSLVGPDFARSPNDDDCVDIDGVAPTVLVRPGTYEEVAAVLRYADNEGLAVIPLGNGDFRSIGNIPCRYDIALRLTRLNTIVEYEPADLTITCQAGATLDDLHPHLRENGQMVPFGKGQGAARIGRLLALPERESNLAWGSARDFTIGMRVVTADGRIIRAGGKVVKNVAGFDLCKLFIGSMGTLGVIVEATFKLAPAPRAEEGIRIEFTSLTEACNFAQVLRSRVLSLWHVRIDRPISLTDAGASARGFHRLTIYLSGTSRAVERSHGEAVELAMSSGGALEATDSLNREGPLPAWTSVGDRMTCELSVLPTLVPRLVEQVDSVAPGAFLDIAPLDGSISMTWFAFGDDEDRLCAVRSIVTTLGGTLKVIGCDPELKRRIDVFGDPPPAFEIMRRVKQEFDPNGILSPGRFVGRL